jgi:hypothetical protein
VALELVQDDPQLLLDALGAAPWERGHQLAGGLGGRGLEGLLLPAQQAIAVGVVRVDPHATGPRRSSRIGQPWGNSPRLLQGPWAMAEVACHKLTTLDEPDAVEDAGVQG